MTNIFPYCREPTMRTHRNLHAPQTVVACYSLFDKFFPACGLLDYTEGIYHNDPMPLRFLAVQALLAWRK